MCLKPMYDLAARPPHAHYFRGITGETLQHAHRLEFFTYPVNGDGSDGHTHNFQGITGDSLEGDVRHFHRFLTKTGPAIGLPDGSHYHPVQTEVDDEPFVHFGNYYRTIFTIPRHKHTIIGRTGTQLGDPPKGW